MSTIANIGSATEKSRGLLTLVSTLNAIGQRTDDVIIVLMFDWVFNRLRTSFNVLSDAYAAAIIHHYCRNSIQEGAMSKFAQQGSNMAEAGTQNVDLAGSIESDFRSSKQASVVKFPALTLPIQNGDVGTFNQRGTFRYVNGTWCSASPHPINQIE